jgi:hypothetical protein
MHEEEDSFILPHIRMHAHVCIFMNTLLPALYFSGAARRREREREEEEFTCKIEKFFVYASC